ncbi:hypothetical protein AKG34_10345 [Peribacillus butanolivorans]|nr:hypothetical protein AKG34_10345 [Peribacillus butanolivorans]
MYSITFIYLILQIVGNTFYFFRIFTILYIVNEFFTKLLISWMNLKMAKKITRTRTNGKYLFMVISQ